MDLEARVFDPMFNLEVKGHPVLDRCVEVYQWEEKKTPFEARKGNMVRRATRCDYHCHWMNANNYVDSSGFRDPSKINTRPSVTNTTFTADEIVASIGPFRINKNEVTKIHT